VGLWLSDGTGLGLHENEQRVHIMRIYDHFWQFPTKVTLPTKNLLGQYYVKVWELEIPALQSGDHSGGKCRTTPA
jgi:hypothetical protein